MKEQFKKVYPIVLPILCLIAGIISITFFFCGPVAKGNYDVLAIGCVAILLVIVDVIIVLIDVLGKKKKK